MNQIFQPDLARRQFLRALLATTVLSGGTTHAWGQRQETGVPFFYPFHAIHTGIEGLVKVYAEVSEEGYVTFVRTETSSGHEILDQAAEGMVALWAFRENLPEAKRKMIIPLQFKLTEKSLKDLPPKDKDGHFKVKKPKVFYPHQANQRNLSGKSSILATVSDAGFAEKALIEESNPAPILNQCALLFTLIYGFGPGTKPPDGEQRQVKLPWIFRIQ
jgi:TonB family protein